MDRFALKPEISIRFRDLDIMGQAHNTIVFIFAEEARVRYFRTVLGKHLRDTNSALVHQEADYLNPISLDDTVTVPYRVTHIGKSSITSEFEVRTNSGTAAKGKSVQVMLDNGDEPRKIPQKWKTDIQEFEECEVINKNRD